ncbi:class I SAM-dependent methyltransferase [Shewanella woodyi]|uniref:Methyltransferase n=1 Tax=Shewanella woodyi (strain ATCC 51908 / MS32) TaxID=392500 RepID=B1KRA2_SHEWM|nr:class I SAM-dependent methyltransferase [Shewanella woodyi]ACA86309.1 hypothetical protein Swoo_2025 [Shewanella woodyi ATCC 51908]
MSDTVSLLTKFNFLQNFASLISAWINPAIIHNLEKYHILKKVHYLTAIENIEGDYLEFGVFTGSSFCHSIRVHQMQKKYCGEHTAMKFYGFDSFSGFGSMESDENHPFYSQVDFNSNIEYVEKRIRRVAKNTEYKLVEGYFQDSLTSGPKSYGIDKSKIIFIDSDTFSSAAQAFEFCSTTIQQGTYIILDDHFSYCGDINRGVAGAFKEFIEKREIEVRLVFHYGMGGSVYVVSNM